jgi:putative holliday junction resolvase
MARARISRSVRLSKLRIIQDDTQGAKRGEYNRIVNKVGRILALDVGKKRIGLALSDELGLTAQGLKTMEREGRRDDIETLRRLVLESGVELILIGDPIHMSGEASRQSAYTREFARELEYKTGLPVKFWDERWTSREAERTLRGSGIAHNERKPAIDRLSAVILLQSYLDSARVQR